MATTEQLLTFAKLFASGGRTKPDDKPVPTALADQCLTAYQTVFSDPIKYSDKIISAYTKSADFSSESVIKWASKIKGTSNVNSIKVCLGLYTATTPGITADHIGRLTVFLYPYYEEYDPITFEVILSQQATYSNLVLPADGNPGDNVDPFNFAGIEP